MKNYGHTWQWGENPEYTIDVCTHWSNWALLLEIGWLYYNDAVGNKNYGIDITFLCFHFGIDIWRWKN